ncbi:MAG TPA: tetratricopeptide repeat protein [Micromonosporaceae bacterium]|nr:tetratricopeptide repeat protein [Micromonosporaceae bacterium]
MSEELYDVFLALAGPDRDAVRRLRDALTAGGLKAFIDERDIREYHGITAEIERALQGSKALVAYYSRHFTNRAACQYELTAAFLAGQREGDPTKRIMVLNPHEETDHLLPVELAEDKFDRLPAPHDDASMSRVVARIATKVAALDGRIGGVPFAERPRWYGRTQGAHEFVGRYRELWMLHSALHRHRFGLTQYVSSGPLTVLVGMPGIGKSELAAAYAWHFGAAYLGGVYWVSLAGSHADRAEVSARFVDALRTLLEQLGIDAGEGNADRVIGRFADHVAAQAEPSLLVVDDVPGLRLTDELVVPAGSHLHTILITNKANVDGPATPVEIGPMSLADSVAVLRRYRDGTDPEIEALAERLGGHPMALRLAGRTLRDQQNLLSYAQFLQRVDHGGTALAPVTALLRDRIAALDTPARRALYISLVCSPAAVPTRLLETLLGSPDTGSAVATLRDQLVATKVDAAWQIHALVRDTAREHLPPAPWATLAGEAAEAVLRLMDHADLEPAAASLLMQHAGHLSARADLTTDVSEALLRRVTAYYDARGEAILAVPHHGRLAERHPDNAGVLAAAARCLLAAGAFAEAGEYAAQAFAVEANPAERLLLAETLDAQARYAEADPLWAELDPNSVAYCRALRLRGQHSEARRILAGLIAGIGDNPARFHEAQSAQLELARTEMETNAQLSARKRALAVMSAYTARGLSMHATAVEATRLFADARLSLSLWELNTDPTTWQDAAEDLRNLRDAYTRTHGPRNTLTLSVAVAYAEALTALGRPGEARRAIEAIEADLADRLGDHDPVVLRSQVVLGYAAAQCGRNEDARRHFRTAYEGQRATLGPAHPHTLRSQFNLGIALKLTGHSAEARNHFNDVRRAAPQVVGRGTDLFGQSFVASVLNPLPAVVWRLLSAKPKPPEDC